MSPAMPTRNSVSCARIFRAVSAGLPLTIRRANMPKLTATTMANEIGKASPAILAAVRCDLSIVLIAISYPPATTEPAACPEQEPLLAFPSGCGDEMAEAGDGEDLSLSACGRLRKKMGTLAQIFVTSDNRVTVQGKG